MMEIDKKYVIWYTDDEGRARRRNVKVISENGHLLEYFNLYTQRIEGIALKQITRYERIEGDERHSKK